MSVAAASNDARSSSPMRVIVVPQEPAPDEYMHELDPEARVWTMYKDRAEVEDKHTMSVWNGTVDQLLLFVRTVSDPSSPFPNN